MVGVGGCSGWDLECVEAKLGDFSLRKSLFWAYFAA